MIVSPRCELLSALAPIANKHRRRNAGRTSPSRAGRMTGSLAIFAAIRRASSGVQRSIKLFDEGACRRQIGKPTTIIEFTFLFNCLSMTGFNVSRVVKVHNAEAQCDIQPIGGNEKFNDVGEFALVRRRLIALHLLSTSLLERKRLPNFWWPK